MQYLATFLEGIITFISPCLLPMLPIYVSYFSGGGAKSTKSTLKNVLGFVLGFTGVFILLGGLAGTLGGLLVRYRTAVDIVSGIIVIFFGLYFLGVIRINLFRGSKLSVDTHNLGFFSAFLFGVIFSIGWTPCVGAFLGSALALASREGETVRGMLMLLCYSVGLGIPFVISALLIDKIKSTFDFIKRNYKLINTVCGILLILMGVLMATGLFGRFLSLMA